MAEIFRVISLSYKKAPLEVRESLTLDEAQTKAFYLKLRDVLGLNEALVLSTCNRTEVYYKSENNLSEALIGILAAEKSVSSVDILPYFDQINEESDASRYLFEVSLGLESQVLGDQQIINQVKNAYQWSADMQMAGPFVHRILHAVFFANKRLVQETAFRDGTASTSYATVDLMESFLPMMNNPKVLVIGLGEIGEDVAKTLFEKGHKNITLCNRTEEKATKMALDFGFEAIAFEALGAVCGKFDVVISTVRSEKYILTEKCLINRKSVTYLFDLSVPRSIDPKVETLPGVVLYELDEIQKKTELAIQTRREAIPQVKAIIAEMVADLSDWSKELQVSPTIQKLKSALEQIRKEEVARYVKGMTDAEAEKVEKITSGMMQKIIKLPVLQLKAACKRGEADTLIDVLNDLFDLEKVNV
jgi:glutamyl-tRNA reductase